MFQNFEVAVSGLHVLSVWGQSYGPIIVACDDMCSLNRFGSLGCWGFELVSVRGLAAESIELGVVDSFAPRSLHVLDDLLSGKFFRAVFTLQAFLQFGTYFNFLHLWCWRKLHCLLSLERQRLRCVKVLSFLRHELKDVLR